MGLSAMADAPDVDQHMRFANIVGQMGYIAPNAWLGENSLDGLGFGETPTPAPAQNFDPNSPAGIANQVIGTAVGVWRQIEADKAAKRAAKSGGSGHSAPIQSSPSSASMVEHSSGGGDDMTKWYLIGGAVLAAAIILYVVMKKKNTKHAEGS